MEGTHREGRQGYFRGHTRLTERLRQSIGRRTRMVCGCKHFGAWLLICVLLYLILLILLIAEEDEIAFDGEAPWWVQWYANPDNNLHHKPNHRPNRKHNNKLHRKLGKSNGKKISQSKRSPILSSVYEVTYEYACHCLANLAHPFRSLCRQPQDPKCKLTAKFTGHPGPLSASTRRGGMRYASLHTIVSHIAQKDIAHGSHGSFLSFSCICPCS